MANLTTIEVLRIPGTLFPRGPYDENASYKFLNFVESGGNGYVCLQPCTGIPVTNTAYWFKFVFRGEKGDAFTYADLTAEQKAELVRDATAAAQAAASSAQSAADDAAAALQKFNTIKAAIDALDPQSTEGSIQTLAAKQGLLEADLNALGPKIGEPIVIPIIETGKYINLSGGVGTTVSMTPTTSGSGYCYRMIDVSEGDVVIVNGTGGSSPRLWGFVDSSNKLLSVANDATATNLRLPVPTDAAKVIINDNTNQTSYVEKTSLKVVVRTSDIVNDLTTGGTGSVLSAEMGKTLNNTIGQVGPELKKSLLESSSTNLYNKNDVDCVAGYFINKDSGNLGLSSTGVLKASGWIAVYPNTYYIGTHTNQFAWYNANKVYISGGINLESAVQSPANAAYIRVSFYIEDDSTNRLNEGQTLLSYEDYSDELAIKSILLTKKQDLLVSGTNIKTIAGQSILGSGNVLVNGSGVGVNGTNFKVLPESSTNVQSVISNTDDLLDNILEKKTSTNLYNKNDADCVDGYFINMDNGNLGLSGTGSLKASGWIPVKPSTYYIGIRTNQIAWYNSSKTYISGEMNINTAIQSPSTAAYIRVSFYISDDATNRLNEGQTLLPYEDYMAAPIYKLKEEQITQYIPEIDDNKVNVGYNLAGTVRFINKVASLANGESLAINTSPSDATCNTISLYANVTLFGDGLIIGKGPTTGIYCAWISVDSTSVKCYYQEGGNTITQVGNDAAHGLTISGFIKVTIITKCNKWEVYVSTMANGESAKGVFYAEFNNAFHRGETFVESKGASLTDVELIHNCNDVRKPIWAFGDSYFGSRSPNRVMYWMNQWGFADKMMVNGFGGRGSSTALQDLLKCLAVGTPKMIVWCLGMNDNQQTIELWQSCVESIKSLCDENGIELIVATIPPVLSPNCVNKTTMNQYLIANNYRLLDVVKAVGADADGHWYGYGTAQDYQSSDTIHPSEYGAKAIAAQWLVDVPEITQY